MEQNETLDLSTKDKVVDKIKAEPTNVISPPMQIQKIEVSQTYSITYIINIITAIL